MMMKSGATLSADRVYRYALWRIWDGTKKHVTFLMLNPSVADENSNDATIRRCMSFANRWGYGGIMVANLFAFRATDPKNMKAAADPIGPENDSYIRAMCGPCALYEDSCTEQPLIVGAWGAHGTFLERAEQVKTMLAADGTRVHEETVAHRRYRVEEVHINDMEIVELKST